MSRYQELYLVVHSTYKSHEDMVNDYSIVLFEANNDDISHMYHLFTLLSICLYLRTYELNDIYSSRGTASGTVTHKGLIMMNLCITIV